MNLSVCAPFLMNKCTYYFLNFLSGFVWFNPPIIVSVTAMT